MHDFHIPVSHQNRVSANTALKGEFEQVWFACHGYRQLSKYFIRKFQSLDPSKHLVLAPEGSHRFYIEGYSGRVGASWMTKEDREVDIANYITYLNTLYDHVMKNVQAKKVNVLGFSQGAATVSRWVADRHIQFDNLILWAGVFPPDMNFEADKQYLNSKKVYVLVGDQDEFINEEAVKQHVNQLREKGIQFELIRFNGNHDVKSTPLEKLAKNL